MSSSSLPTTAPPTVFRRRRADLASSLSRPLVILAGQPRARKYATNTHPFRAASSYLYFGGPRIEGGAIVIEPGSDGNNGCALVRSVMGFDDIVWIGCAPSDEQLSSASGLDQLISPDEVDVRLRGREAAYVGPPCPPTLSWAHGLGLQPANQDEILAIINLRLIQDEHEMVAMRRAAKIGMDAQLSAVASIRAGRTEADVAGAYLSVLTAHQCDVSFNPIITVHGEVLHCDGYPGTLGADNLVVFDAGVEEPGGYASDMTRTYPVAGSFTTIQRQLYDTVLRSQCAAVDACVPGKRFRDIHDLSARVICEGLVEAELLRGDPAELAGRGAHTLFYPHGLGHLIGLDVHDMEDFGDLAGYAPGRTRRTEFGSKFLRLDRDLEPGMTVTIEPGVYIAPAIWRNEDLLAPFADSINRGAIDALVRGEFGGIRIEDSVHIRAGDAGPENLTAELPKEADAVADLIRKA